MSQAERGEVRWRGLGASGGERGSGAVNPDKADK